jgi:hypothetical protein
LGFFSISGDKKAMCPFPRKDRFPGVKLNAEGTIDFTLTNEEANAADLALQGFKDVLVHPEVAEKVRNGTIAVALCHYAKNLIAVHCAGLTETEYKNDWDIIEETLEKAVAAVWKSYSLCPIPIFLYHRACFLQMLGLKNESRELYSSFLRQYAEYKTDQVDKSLLEYEGTDIDHALSHAKEEA